MVTNAQINEKQIEINLLIERILAIPGETQAAQNSIFSAGDDAEIKSIMDRVAVLKLELSEKRLQQLEGEILLNRWRAELILAEADEVRKQYEEALDLLPETTERFQAAKVALEDLNSRITILSNAISGKEKSAQQYLESTAELENLTSEFFV